MRNLSVEEKPLTYYSVVLAAGQCLPASMMLLI
jgi:hypothetical protein